MIKVKRILISLAVFWLVCYASMFLLNVIIFNPSSPAAGDLSTQQIVDPSITIVKVSASSIAPALVPGRGQSEKVDFFTRLILPASVMTVMAGLAVACGYQLIGIYGNAPLLK